MAQTQFVVPQFLDVEPKIIGPITARQFLIMLATLLICFAIYRIFLNIVVVIALVIPTISIGVAFAFAKVNGQAFHFIVVSVIQTLRRPGLRVWDKTLRDSDLKAALHEDKPEQLPEIPHKQPLERSRLSELALIVNTGGVYEPDAQDDFF
jgi:hypothetical protein